MNIIDIILNPIIGLVIGYFTNWLAIKMLFKPLTEKRLFGKKLPFTPGLIPKERFRLAEKVGSTVSENILTEEVLKQSISSPEINEKMEKAVDGVFLKLRENDQTLAEVLKGSENGQFDLTQIEKKLSEWFADFCCNESYQNKAADFICGKINFALKNPERIIKKEAVSAFVQKALETALPEVTGSEQFADIIKLLVSELYKHVESNEGTLEDIVPKSLVAGFKKIIYDNVGNVASFISELPERNAEIDITLNRLFRKIAHDNFGTLIGIFVNYDKMYVNLKNNLIEYIMNTEHQALFADIVSNELDKLLAKDIKVALDGLSKASDRLNTWNNRTEPELLAGEQTPGEDGIIEAGIQVSAGENSVCNKIADSIIGFTQNYFADKERIHSFDEVIQVGINKLYDQDIYTWVLRIESQFENKLRAFVYQKVAVVSSAAQNAVETHLSQWANKLLDVKISRIYEKWISRNEEIIKTKIILLIQKAVEKGGGYVIQNMDIGEIIEKKLNEFEVEEAEELILQVVNRELKLITILGGVFGFIIGFVPVIIDLIK